MKHRALIGIAAQPTLFPSFLLKNYALWAFGVLTIEVIKDPTIAVTKFRQNSLDVLNVPSALTRSVLDDAGKPLAELGEASVVRVTAANLKYIAFNMQRAPWGKDRELRARLSAAIDRAQIVARALQGNGEVQTSIVPNAIAH